MNQFRVTFSDEELEETHHHHHNKFITDEDDDEELFLGRDNRKNGYFAGDLEEEVQGDPLFIAKMEIIKQKRHLRRVSIVLAISIVVGLILASVLGFSIYINVKDYFSERLVQPDTCLIHINSTHPMNSADFNALHRTNRKSVLGLITDKEYLHIPNKGFESEFLYLTGLPESRLLQTYSHLFMSKSSSGEPTVTLCFLTTEKNYGYPFNLVDGDFGIDFVKYGDCNSSLSSDHYIVTQSNSSLPESFWKDVKLDANIQQLLREKMSHKSQQEIDVIGHAYKLSASGFIEMKKDLSSQSVITQQDPGYYTNLYSSHVRKCASDSESYFTNDPVVIINQDAHMVSLEMSYSYHDYKPVIASTFLVGSNNSAVIDIVTKNIELVLTEAKTGVPISDVSKKICDNNLELLHKSNIIVLAEGVDFNSISHLSSYFCSSHMVQPIDDSSLGTMLSSNMVVSFDVSVYIPSETTIAKVSENKMTLQSKGFGNVIYKDTFLITESSAKRFLDVSLI